MAVRHGGICEQGREPGGACLRSREESREAHTPGLGAAAACGWERWRRVGGQVATEERKEHI
jgi:hypothetical protein